MNGATSQANASSGGVEPARDVLRVRERHAARRELAEHDVQDVTMVSAIAAPMPTRTETSMKNGSSAS